MARWRWQWVLLALAGLGTQAWLLADGGPSGQPTGGASSPAGPPTERWGPGPYEVRFVTLLVEGPKPIHPPPPSPISEEMNYGSSVLLSTRSASPVPSVVIEQPGQQSGASAMDLDVNALLASWKGRYPDYKVEVFSTGKVSCQNGHYCTVDIRPMSKGADVTLSATDNIRIEEQNGTMTIVRRGSIQMVESTSDNGTSTSSLHWDLKPWLVSPGLLYTGSAGYTQHGEEVIYAYSIVEGSSPMK